MIFQILELFLTILYFAVPFWSIFVIGVMTLILLENKQKAKEKKQEKLKDTFIKFKNKGY